MLQSLKPKDDKIYIRLADNLNFYVYWDKENNEISVGQLPCYVSEESRLWSLNRDKTISPVSSDLQDYVIGAAEVEGKGMVL